LKISFYGAPIFIDDVLLIKELYEILNGFYFIAFVAVVLLTLIGLLFSVNIKKLFAFDVVAIMFILVAPIIFYPQTVAKLVKNQFGYVFWDQKVNYTHMGSLAYLYQALARYQIETPTSPTQIEVENTLNKLAVQNIKNENCDFNKRNIYIILLESFWDASVLKDANLSQDCFVPSFRKLIQQKQENFALSPVFGGKTANAEFEMLCGQPVTFGKGLIFQTSVHNDVECLPKLMQDEGYDVSAWHPNRATFFNRMKAYRRVGFNNRFFKDKFDFKDKNGPFLSDEELYKKVIKYNKKLTKPHLTYIMTITGHWGYPLNKKRKKIIKTSSDVKEVENYVNSIYYTSKEFMVFYDEIMKYDPDALIVLTGDHLPFLGNNFAGFVESGVLKKSISDFSNSMYLDYVSTPLLILDGKKGKVDVGTVSMYDIPHIILKLLGYKKENIMSKLKNNTGNIIRTFDGLNLVVTDTKDIIKCTKQSVEKECLESNEWVDSVNLISRDLFLGEQYSIQTND
jgi:phosphoglycerol transferase MdoB-like AlkP superfamily enzyme